jgi:hypothetical protein
MHAFVIDLIHFFILYSILYSQLIGQLCWYAHCIVCQEKYLRELSVTPVGYFTGAKSLPWAWGVPQGLFCMAWIRYFRATGMIFPRLPLRLMEFEGIWGQYLQLEVNKFTTPHGSFCGRLRALAQSRPFPGRPCHCIVPPNIRLV